MSYFNTNAGKAVLSIGAAVFLLAWPPALPWIAAVALLQLGVKHLKLAFKESDFDLSIHASHNPLPPPGDGQRELAVTGSGALPARSQV